MKIRLIHEKGDNKYHVLVTTLTGKTIHLIFDSRIAAVEYLHKNKKYNIEQEEV